jgi:hypothetical protein
MSDLRRRGSYPIQSAEYSPNTSPPPVQSPIEEAKEPLPVSIRALKNSAKSTDHGRTAIICLDGTGDQFDNDNSNVVHFVSCLKKHTPGQQVTYYQSGIGTYDSGGLKNGVGAALDMAVGSGLGIHIKDAYRFLYVPHISTVITVQAYGKQSIEFDQVLVHHFYMLFFSYTRNLLFVTTYSITRKLADRVFTTIQNAKLSRRR